MRTCIISDPYCDQKERESRKLVADLFKAGIRIFDAGGEIDTVWMPELDMRCSKGRVQIGLPNGRTLDEYDLIYPRLFLDQPMLAIAVLEAANLTPAYVPFGASGYTYTLHKFLSLMRAAKLGVRIPESSILPTPEVSVSDTKKRVRDRVAKLVPPVVFKRLSGYGGAGVLRISEKSELRAVVDAFAAMDEVLIAQTFIPSKGDPATIWDLRVMVVGNEVHGIKRTGKSDVDFRTGVSTGGSAGDYPLTPELSKAALDLSEDMNLPICGIDFVESERDGYAFLEINCTPGMYMSSKTQLPLRGVTPNFVHLVSKFLVESAQAKRRRR